MQINKTYCEEDLVRMLAEKNLSAFSSLYKNYADSLYGIILRIVQNKESAEDVLQEAFMKILANIDTYDRTKGRLFTWMAKICRNLAIDMTRSKAFGKEMRTSSVEFFPDILHNQSGSEMYDTIGIRKKTLLLSPDHKLVIDLAYFNGLTQLQIAEILNVPLGTVKTRLRAAITNLKKLIDPVVLRA